MANIGSFTSPPSAANGMGPGQTAEFLDAGTTSTPGVTQTLITRVVGAAETFFVSSVVVTCRQTACYEVKEDAAIIASGRIGAANPNDKFHFTIPRPVASGTTLTVDFKQLSGTTAGDVEAYVIGYAQT